MKLSALSEAGVKKIWNPGWEREVKLTLHYLKKSKDPFKFWSPRDLVMAFALDAKYIAKSIIKEFGLTEDDLDDLVQTGLLGAYEQLEKLHVERLRPTMRERKPFSGRQLIPYIKNNIYNSMIQGGHKGEDWRSTTTKDLRASKVSSRDPSRGTMLTLNPAAAVGLMRGLEDSRDNFLDVETREELAYAVDGITKERTRDIMRRFLGVVGSPPVHAQDLAPEFGVSQQSIGQHIKKGLRELKSILDEIG